MFDPHVVVDHHVPPGDDDPVDAAQHLVDLRILGRAGPTDQHRLAAQDGFADDLEPGLPQGGSGRHDVGDDVGDPEPDGGLHRAVEPHDLGVDAPVGEVAAHDAGVGGRHALARELFDAGHGAGDGGVAERRAAEPEREHLLGIGFGVEQQVAPRHPEVDLAGADVGGDVAGAEEEELDVVVGVDQDQLTAVAALTVARLGEQLGSGLGQGALVGDGDAQHQRDLG
ncbi:MAG: hypothetical protein WEB09_01575, partial [Nitriliruptor sp.]